MASSKTKHVCVLLNCLYNKVVIVSVDCVSHIREDLVFWHRNTESRHVLWVFLCSYCLPVLRGSSSWKVHYPSYLLCVLSL